MAADLAIGTLICLFLDYRGLIAKVTVTRSPPSHDHLVADNGLPAFQNQSASSSSCSSPEGPPAMAGAETLKPESKNTVVHHVSEVSRGLAQTGGKTELGMSRSPIDLRECADLSISTTGPSVEQEASILGKRINYLTQSDGTPCLS